MDLPSSDKPDTNPNPKPSALRTNSAKQRPIFGASGKSLSFEEQIFTVIPNDPMFEFPDNNTKKKRLQRVRWWEPNHERNLAQYCMSTSIHGLKYLGEPKRHIFERIFWLVAFCLSCLVTSYLINNVWLKYSENPVIITFQPYQTFVEQIPFPAVTICNMNKVLKSKAEEFMRSAVGPEDDIKTQEAWQNTFYLDHVCSTSNKPFSTIFNYTSTQGTVDPNVLELVSSKVNPDKNGKDVAQFLQLASQSCTDMIKLCLWQGEVFNCSKLFKPIETNFGKCCTFNMVPQSLLHRYMDDPRDDLEDIKDWKEWGGNKDGLIDAGEEKKKYPRRQYRGGKTSGLSFLVDPDLDEYYCTSSDSTGFRLATHFSTDVPHVADFGLAIQTNSDHYVSVQAEITVADDTIKDIRVDKRGCYLDGEHHLKYYKYYTAANCYDECIANITYEKCRCVRYYMPRDTHRAICAPSKYTCAENVKKESFMKGVKSICQKCLPSCTEIKYNPIGSVTPFRKRVDLWKDSDNISTTWAKSNISIIHVYMGQESTYARVRSQLYGLTDLIANFGGLMGLCMGFSGLSLIEAIYFFTMRVWFRKNRKRYHKQKKEKREAADRDREKAIAYLGVGSRRSSVDSIRSNSFNNKPIFINDKDSSMASHGFESSPNGNGEDFVKKY